MKQNNQIYDALITYSVHSAKKVKAALEKLSKTHKTYITEKYSYVAKVDDATKNNLVETMRGCATEVNGKNYKVVLRFSKYIEKEPQPVKNKKPSNNNKSVARKAKSERKADNKKKFSTRKKHIRSKKAHHPRGTKEQLTTIEIRRRKRANAIGRALIKAEERNAATTQKKQFKSNLSADKQQKLNFAA